jgi:hypothetical protein
VRRQPIPEWEVLPSPNTKRREVHTVSRYLDARFGDTVSVEENASSGDVVRFSLGTARSIAEAILAAAEWTDEPTQHATPEPDAPRQWQAGNREPDDVTKVRDGLTLLLERHPDGWHPAGCPRTKCVGMSWWHMNFPLTEVSDA